MPQGSEPSRMEEFSSYIAERDSKNNISIRLSDSSKVYNISRTSQFFVLTLLTLLGLWCGITTANWFVGEKNSSAQQAKMESLLQTYKIRNSYLEEERNRMSASLDDAEERFAEVTQKIALAAQSSAQKFDSVDFSEQFEAVQKRINKVVEERNRLSKRLEETSLQLAEYSHKMGNASTENEESRAMLASLSERLTQAIKERDDLQAKLSVMKSQVNQSSEDVKVFGGEHEKAIMELERVAAQTLKNVRDVLERTGVDVTQILGTVEATDEAQDYMGQGGPYMPLDQLAIRGQKSFAAALRLQSIFDQYREINLLAIASNRFPFGMPTSVKRISSSFGYRKDPFNGRPAFHGGIDYPGPVGTPIYSTSKGTVVFAGKKGGYGNIIEIDHGLGFTTRYAHLSSFAVSVGDKVEQGDYIAGMGNTGRSTGSHLHYEVRYMGKLLNPANFARIVQ